MGSLVSTVLKRKGNRVLTVGPEDTVATVAGILSSNRIGAVPVIDRNGRVVGILSERDIVNGVARHGEALLAFPADRIMTRAVKTCSPRDDIVEIAQVMTDRHIRHLPVVEDGALLGIVSIGDVVKERLEEAEFEVEALRTYISS